jgi:hypothetical protein
MHEAEQATEIALAVAAGERDRERVFVQSESGLFSCWPVTLISTASLAPPLNRLLGSIEVLVHRTTRPWERGNTRRAQLLLATVALGVVVMACLAPSASTLSPVAFSKLPQVCLRPSHYRALWSNAFSFCVLMLSGARQRSLLSCSQMLRAR